MKFPLSLALVSVFALAACETDEPPPRRPQRPVAKYPTQTATTTTTTQQYPPAPQPFGQAPPVQDPAVAPVQDPITEQPVAPVTNTAAVKGDYPYGVPVPGKPGFVRSPYSPDKMTDVRGYAPGTEVKDPYTQKIFLVP
ncbi:MAG: hypothetical protein ABI883_06935 [Chthoniobacterales bacterium]